MNANAFCTACGMQLPAGVELCPTCGAVQWRDQYDAPTLISSRPELTPISHPYPLRAAPTPPPLPATLPYPAYPTPAATPFGQPSMPLAPVPAAPSTPGFPLSQASSTPLQWEYAEMLVPLNVSVSTLWNGYVAQAARRAQPVIAAYLQRAQAEGWQPDEPTDLAALFDNGRITREYHHLGFSFVITGATIRVKRLAASAQLPVPRR